MDLKINDDDNLDDLNEGYLKEMETNNNLFEEKIKKLNNLLANNNNIISENKNNNKINNYDDKISNKDIEIKYLNDIDNEKNLNNKQLSKEILLKNTYKNYKDIDLNSNSNYTSLKQKIKDNKRINENEEKENYLDYKIKNNNKNKNSQRDVNKYSLENDIISNNKNIEIQREINQLKNENKYKDYLIKDLRNQISQKNNKEEKAEVFNNNEYNSLLKDIDKRDLYIEKLEKDIKNLKFKIDNLIIENKKIKNENDNLLSQREELRAESDVNKIDLENNKEKFNKLELMYKKLNKDYLDLSNDYKLMKEEKENLKSIIDEQNATIFNYEKQLKTKTSERRNYNKKRSIFNERMNNFTIDDDHKNIIRESELNDKYNYSNEKYNKYNYSIDKNNFNNEKYNYDYKNERYNYDYKKDYSYDKRNKFNITTRSQKNFYSDKFQNEKNDLYSLSNDYKWKKYNYNNDIGNDNDNNNNLSRFLSEKNKIKKGELNYLENYLSSLLKERAQLENSLSEIPNHPRTLQDIKLKNRIKDKITQNDKEIFNIQKQLKVIRGQKII